MMRHLRAGLVLWALAIAAVASLPRSPANAQPQEPVDLLLVLAADVSRSVDDDKFQLQREGYAAALSDPRVLDAIRSGPNRRIAVLFMEWSGQFAQRVIVDWMAVGDEQSARRFGDHLLESQRSFAERTSISAAIDLSVELLDRAPFRSFRRTIDVSGDGTNNSGRDVRLARDEAVAKDVTINGLVILSERPLPWNPDHAHPPGGLTQYYRDNVIGGPGAFVLTAENFESFGKALINKLVAEIARRSVPAEQDRKLHAEVQLIAPCFASSRCGK